MNKNEGQMSGYLSEKNLSRFLRESYERGERYYDEGEVELTYIDRVRGEYHANVRGAHTYNVRLDISPSTGEIKKAFCNCPYQGAKECKHIAATLLAVADASPLSASLTSSKDTGAKSSASSLEEVRASSFKAIISDIESGSRAKSSLPFLLSSLYSSLKSRFYLTSLPSMEKELKEIESAFAPDEDLSSSIFLALARICFGESKTKFYAAALSNPSFHKAAFSSFFKEVFDRSAYEIRGYIYDDDFRERILSSCSSDELTSLLSSSLSSCLGQNEVIEAAKKRKEYGFLLAYGSDMNYARGESFYFKMGIAAEEDDREVAKKLYRKMLHSYDISLKNFLYYYHFLSETERKEEELSFSFAMKNKGLESAYAFLFKGEKSLIRYFSLPHFAYMSGEIKALGRPIYEKYLLHAIEVGLNKGERMKEETSEQLLLILDSYDEDILHRYALDERTGKYVARLSFKQYFRLLYEHGLTKEAHYEKWER